MTSSAAGHPELRIAVVGAGQMGADHITRITRRITGAQVAAVVEPDADRATAAAADAPGASIRTNIEEALEHDDLDAVLIATPGKYHKPVLLPALQAGVAILCEKPLTPGSEEAWEILEAEQKLDRPHIQVGFMRRFDTDYQKLRALIQSGDAGELLALHCAHRNPTVPDSYTEQMLINDSVVHEIDVVPWLAGSPIVSIEVKKLRQNRHSNFPDPQLVILELATGALAIVEINVSMQFGYQVKTEAVFENGLAEIGVPGGMTRWQDGQIARAENTSFVTRFAAAYDSQIQHWVDAAAQGRIDGPSAWDGYRVAVGCEAGVKAQSTGMRVDISSTPRPAFYGG